MGLVLPLRCGLNLDFSTPGAGGVTLAPLSDLTRRMGLAPSNSWKGDVSLAPYRSGRRVVGFNFRVAGKEVWAWSCSGAEEEAGDLTPLGGEEVRPVFLPGA